MRTEMIRPEERYALPDQRPRTTNGNNMATEKTPDLAVPANGTTETTEVNDKQLEEIIAKLNKTADIFELNVQYKVKYHEETNAQIVQIVKNDEVVVEMPPERLLDALAKIEENLLGVVVDKRV